MNLQEFKAWFEGFTDGIELQPTTKQWKKIQEKVASIKDSPPITKEVFIRDYWYPNYPYYWGRGYWAYASDQAIGVGQITCGTLTDTSKPNQNTVGSSITLKAEDVAKDYKLGNVSLTTSAVQQFDGDVPPLMYAANPAGAMKQNATVVFNSLAAFHDLGKAERAAMEAESV